MKQEIIEKTIFTNIKELMELPDRSIVKTDCWSDKNWFEKMPDGLHSYQNEIILKWKDIKPTDFYTSVEKEVDGKQEIIVIETFSEDDCFYTDPINEVACENETDALEYALKHAYIWAKDNNKGLKQTDEEYYSKKEVVETVKEMVSDGSDFGQCGLVIRRIPLFRKE